MKKSGNERNERLWLELKLKMLKEVERIYQKHPGLKMFDNCLLFKFWVPERIKAYKKGKAEKWSVVSRKGWGDDSHWLITFHLGACGAQVMLRKIHIAYY